MQLVIPITRVVSITLAFGFFGYLWARFIFFEETPTNMDLAILILLFSIPLYLPV